MVSLLFVEESLRSEGDNEKKRKRVKRNEIQCMIIFIENLLLLFSLNLVSIMFSIYFLTSFK